MKLMLVCALLVLAVTLPAAAPRYVKSNAVTRVQLVDTASFVHTHRRRRQTQTLTPSQKSEMVDHHNVLRAVEGADNMELMVPI